MDPRFSSETVIWEAVVLVGTGPSRLALLVLLDGRVGDRRRQGLGINCLPMMEAAGQHDRGGEDGESYNSAHKTNPPKRDFQRFTPRLLEND
jgi:hypothetical protein